MPAFVAIKPVFSFDARSEQQNYGRDLALHFFERAGFSMDLPVSGLPDLSMLIGYILFKQEELDYRVDSLQTRAALTNRNSRVSQNSGAKL
jgi:hypothetical protein